MGAPSAVARMPDQLDVFNVDGADTRVWTEWWHAGADWGRRPIGGFFPARAPVACLARERDHLDVFVCGNDGRVYTSWWHAGTDWSGARDNWRAIGGYFPAGAAVAAVTREPNHLDLFITGGDGRVYTSWWHAGTEWSGINDNWRSIGGVFPPGAPVAAVSREPNHLDLFITGNDGRVYTSWWHAGTEWSGINDNWRPIGGYFPAGAAVAAVSREPNHLDLFITGNDGRVYTCWWHAGTEWSGINDNWRSIGGYFAAGAPVAAVAREPNHLDLFITGNDGRVYTSWWHAGTEWSGINDSWRSIGGYFPPGAQVAAVSREPNQLDLFITGNDGRVYTSWWHAGSEWSGLNDTWLVLPLTIRLNFNMEPQQQTNWCWAAVSKSVAAYYEPATTWTQCEVANGERGRTDCCTNGSSADCNQYGTLNTALQRVGHLDRMVSAPATFTEMYDEVRRGRPVGARTAWAGGGAHFLAIIGSVGGGFLAVDDPIYAKSDVSDSAFRTMYQGSGTWTHTYYTR